MLRTRVLRFSRAARSRRSGWSASIWAVRLGQLSDVWDRECPSLDAPKRQKPRPERTVPGGVRTPGVTDSTFSRRRAPCPVGPPRPRHRCDGRQPRRRVRRPRHRCGRGRGGRAGRVGRRHGQRARRRSRPPRGSRPTVGPGAELLGRVVREVGDRGCSVFDTEAERPSSLVRDLRGEHTELLEVVPSDVEVLERPRTAELVGPDREVRGRHRACQQVVGAFALRWEEQPHRGVVPIDRRAEGKPLRVVPAQVAEQDRADERTTIEEPGQ